MTSAPSCARPAPLTSRCWTVQVQGRELDVEVSARDDDTLADVVPELVRACGVSSSPLVPAVWSGSSRLAAGLPMHAPELSHGAVLGLGGPGPRPLQAIPSTAVALNVLGGPDAGRALPLSQGEHVLGRGGGADVSLDDPLVSRRHALVRVANTRITVSDLDSSNGTWLDGARTGQTPQSWAPGAVLRIGSTSLTVAAAAQCPVQLQSGAGGRRIVRAAPRLTAPQVAVEVAFPRAPAASLPRPLAWVGVALPAAGGALMAWLLHTPSFLFFALLSPVVAVGTWLSDRWSGRRSGRRAATAHQQARRAAQHRLTEALRAHRRAAYSSHPDLAVLSAAATRPSAPLWSRRRDDPDALSLRLGLGTEPTPVTRVTEEGARVVEHAPDLPAALDLRAAGGLGVVGPRAATLPLVYGFVAQLATLHPPGDLDLLLLVDPARLGEWRWARWLPHLRCRTTDAGDDRLHEDLSVHLAGRNGEQSGWLVVVVDAALGPRTATLLRAAREARVLVLTAARSADELPVAADAVLVLGGELGQTAVLRRSGETDRGPLVLDRLQHAPAALLARALAALAPGRAAAGLPDRVRLLDLVEPLPLGQDIDGRAWPWSRTRGSLVATLGDSGSGPVTVDLCREGPHALVAGTTGSGKSELLQTLIAGLALAHPPDRCSFLLVDYKGGAAFAEAASLPHTVGLLTDLDTSTTARALRSLTAELSRRESVLAAHGVADLVDLPADVPLARLVIVVDEFATLAEELPAFVPGLVGIAQRGRSLGVHLVLATQRPSGVVSPEIRANCSLRVCLRTTDDGESRDVLGTPEAAHLPIDLPGRAYLRVGNAPPLAVQVARVSGAREQDGRPEVRAWSWPGGMVAGRPGGHPRSGTDLAALTAALRQVADAQGSALPHRPWRPPLPERVDAADLAHLVAGTNAASSGSGGRYGIDGSALRVPLALVDRPDRQGYEALQLDLGEGGAWLAVGGARSGRTTFLRTVLTGSARLAGPDRLHVHVLDHGGGQLAREAERLPQAGTCVGPEDPLRTVRLVDRLTAAVAERRAQPSSTAFPLLLLLVDGVESLLAQLDEADPVRGSTAFLRLLRDGAAVGLTCAVTGERAVPGGRLAAVARQRLVLPLPDRADYAVAGIPAAAIPTHRPPGRALVGEEAREGQLLLPSPVHPDSFLPAAAGSDPPLRIVELPADPAVHHGSPPRAVHVDVDVDIPAMPVTVGPGGDEGNPLRMDLLRTGGLLIVGPPRSGRSSTLAALAAELTAAAVPVAHLGTGRGRETSEQGDVRLPAADSTALGAWMDSLPGGRGAVVVDDVGALPDWPALAGISLGSPGGGLVVLVAGTAADLAAHFQGPVAWLRRTRTGLLLRPGPAEADVLGIRLPRTPLPQRPGSGWLVTSGVPERVQVARRRIVTSPPRVGRRHSSSSTGPISCVAYQANS